MTFLLIEKLNDRWQFVTEDGDIGFHILFIKSSGDEMPMIARDRIESHELMEEGEIACIYSGICNNNLFFKSLIQSILSLL